MATPTTSLSPAAIPRAGQPLIGNKTALGLPPVGVRIAEFDVWRPGYAGAVVEVVEAGTTSLAPIYSDPFLTVPAVNPQTLGTLTDSNGATYGKWPAPIYTYVNYSLVITSGGETGVERVPLFTIDGTDASLATVASVRGGYPVSLNAFADRDIDITLVGPFTPAIGSAACNETLALAVGIAAAQGGGDVLLPPGTFPILNITLAQGVRLRGKGKGTTTLTSLQTTQPVITLGGDGAGLASLTLDGLDLAPGSIGVFGVGTAFPHFDEVVVQRFETGIRFRGIANALWRDLSVSNCGMGAELRGDSDTAVSGTGSSIDHVSWDGGDISLCTTYGLYLMFFDRPVIESTIANVSFTANSGDALRLKGTRGIRFENCEWDSNVSDLLVTDGDDVNFISQNTTERIRFIGGHMVDGTLTFTQTCFDIQLQDMSLSNTSGVLSVPINPIVLQDCISDATVSYTGDLTKLLTRNQTAYVASVSGITTDATETAAWSYTMQPGEAAFLTAKVIGKARNGRTLATFWVMAAANRPGATMNFDSATGNFTAGLTIVGQTSGASGLVTFVDQTGATGTLTLRTITGTFQSGEVVADSSTGNGRFQGALGTSDAALDPRGSEDIRPPQIVGAGTGGGWITPWVVAVDTLGAQVRLMLTGEVSVDIEWEAEVSFLKP